jgi:predicted Zn-dependent protease
MIGATVGAANAASIDLGKIFDVGKDVATATKSFDEKDEIEIGRELAGRTLGAAPLVNDPELQTYVNRVGRWVASQTDRPDLPWTFGVIDTSSLNAFAAPGGYVLITRGLYEILDNEAQLAGVIGHEIAHIIRRHHITVMQKSAAVSAGARLVQRDNRGLFINNLIGEGATIFSRGLDKSAEYEADEIGVILAARAGYNPYGLVEVLHKLAARGTEDASLALLYKTHPQPSDRLTSLGDALMPLVASLPEGKEPPIRQVSADVPLAPATAGKPAPAGARALRQEEPPPALRDSRGGVGVDPGSLLKGLFGR